MTNEDYMKLAFREACFSDDSETKVGCVIVDPEGYVGGTGRNHTVGPGCPTKRPEKYPYMVHAEIHALVHNVQQPHVMFVTLSPCHECCKAIIAANITKVFFVFAYEGYEKSIAFLQKFGVDVECMEDPR